MRFLVIEPAKGEYKNVFGNRSDVAVYGTNPQLGELLRINPFSFPKEVHIYEHLDRLVEIFNVCWPMYAAMPAILKDAVERAYVNAGWDLRRSRNRYSNRLFPNFVDVLQQIDVVMEQSQYSRDNKSDYKGALSTRIRSLTNGINGLVFSSDEIPAEDLFDRNVVIDLSRVGSTETKSLIMGLLVMKLQEHRIAASTDMNAKLRHVTVLEEAHNLLKRTSTEQSSEGANLLGKSVEMLTNAIAEMRTYGEGFIIADQSPGLLDVSVIRNTNTKIIMRLPEYTDRELVGRAAGLSDDQINELAKLTKGVAAVYQNDWLEAVLCKVRKYTPRQTHPYRPAPDTAANTADIKGKIISRLAIKDIDHLLKGIAYPDVLSADMPVLAKVRLLEYAHAPEAGRTEYAAAVAYELFSAQQAFAAMEGARLDCNQQKRFLLAHLQPALTPLPEKYAQAILCLIAYRHARLTDNARDRQLVKHLLEV
ncbi:MAG: ATP-binding protein [Candidatus Spyradocola sp.]